MDELILPPDCKYDLKKHRWVCSGVELIIGSVEDEEHYEEEEYYEECMSPLIPAELCGEEYEEEEYYEEYEDY
jgi:hypothetical protein